jgi:hypothetical protein
MTDFWNDPPETPEPPQCCGDYMDFDETSGNCSCPTCGKIIEPEPEMLEPWPNDEEITHSLCPHGIEMAECNDCMIASDFAFDASREKSWR